MTIKLSIAGLLTMNLVACGPIMSSRASQNEADLANQDGSIASSSQAKAHWPALREVTAHPDIPTELMQHFAFYAQAEGTSDQIYYAPHKVEIAKTADYSQKPEFTIQEFTESNPPLAGEKLLRIAGKWDLLKGSQGHRKILSLARFYDVNLHPAPVHGWRVEFLIGRQAVREDGTFEVDCFRSHGGHLVAPDTKVIADCFTKNSVRPGYDINLDLVYKFFAHVSADQYAAGSIPFQLTTTPNWQQAIADQLQHGGAWDSIVQGIVTWKLPGPKPDAEVTLEIDWEQLSETALSEMSRHGFKVSTHIMKSFLEDLLMTDEWPNAVRVQWTSGISREELHHQPHALEAAIAEMEWHLASRIFQRLKVDSDTSGAPLWTLRGRYHGPRHESLRLPFSKSGPAPMQVTQLNATCIEGEINRPLRWSQREACKTLLDY